MLAMKPGRDYTSTNFRRMIGKYLRDLKEEVRVKKEKKYDPNPGMVDCYWAEVKHWLRCGMLIRAIDDQTQQVLEDQLYHLCRQLRAEREK